MNAQRINTPVKIDYWGSLGQIILALLANVIRKNVFGQLFEANKMLKGAFFHFGVPDRGALIRDL